MKLPEIELNEIPGLPTRTSVYGGLQGGGHNDDTVIVVMVFVYNSTQNTQD